MPRSFLVKKHQSGSRKPNYGGVKSMDGETPWNSHVDTDIPPLHCHPGSSLHLQHRAQAISSSSSSCCSLPFRTDQLCPSSSSASCFSFFDPCTEAYTRCSEEAYKPEHSCTKMDVNIQCVVPDPTRLPSSIPLVALFPATPPGSGSSSSSSSSGSQEHFECLDCHKEYLSYSGLPKHKQLYCEWSSKKCFSCKYCEKEYASLGALKMHIRTHTLPCVCKLCGKAFSRPWLLQGHIRTHTGEKPFTCLHCSRAFADRSNLRAHLQTHSEVKKYQCTSCYKTFSRISLLAKHQEAGCPLS